MPLGSCLSESQSVSVASACRFRLSGVDMINNVVQSEVSVSSCFLWAGSASHAADASWTSDILLTWSLWAHLWLVSHPPPRLTNRCVCVRYLDGVFEGHQVDESLLAARGHMVDAGVQISQLSGSDGFLAVHLDHSTVGCSPPTRSCALKRRQTVKVTAGGHNVQKHLRCFCNRWKRPLILIPFSWFKNTVWRIMEAYRELYENQKETPPLLFSTYMWDIQVRADRQSPFSFWRVIVMVEGRGRCLAQCRLV